MTKLTTEQQQALHDNPDGPVEVVDPGTNKVYVLVSADVYERIKPLFEQDPMSESEQRHLLLQAGKRAGWDAPEMDAYDDYDAHRPKP
jgi:hypothetical protein